MTVSPQLESSPVLFAPFIEELHHFFGTWGVHFGSPADLPRFVQRLSAPGPFREELTSMVRRTISSQPQSPTRVELLEAMAFAVGGPALDLQAPDLKEPVRQLFAFVCSLVRSLLKANDGGPSVFTPDRAAEDVFPARSASAEPDLKRAIFPSQTLFSRTPSAARVVDEEPVPEPEEEPEPEVAAPWVPEMALPRTPFPVDYPAPEPTGLLSRASWVVLGCALAAGLAMGLLQHERKGAPKTDASGQSRTTDFPLAAVPKPSPYGEDFAAEEVAIPPAETRAAAGRTAAATRAAAASRPSVDKVPWAVASPARGYGVPRREVAEPDASYAETRRAATPVPQPGDSTAHPSAEPPTYSNALRTASSRAYPSVRPVEPSALSSTVLPLSVPRSAELERAFPVVPHDVFLASSGIMTAHLVSAPAPEYPALASAEKVEGQVTLQAVVGRDGLVVSTRVVHGNAVLGEAAEEAVRHWTYRPYVMDGRPTEISTLVTVGFRLHR